MSDQANFVSEGQLRAAESPVPEIMVRRLAVPVEGLRRLEGTVREAFVPEAPVNEGPVVNYDHTNTAEFKASIASVQPAAHADQAARLVDAQQQISRYFDGNA